MSLIERWQGRRYRRRYGLRSRSGALDAALAAMRERPDLFVTPGGRSYVDALRKLAGCPCGGDRIGGEGCTCDPPFGRG